MPYKQSGAMEYGGKYGYSHTESRIFGPKTHKNTATDTGIAVLFAVLELKS